MHQKPDSGNVIGEFGFAWLNPLSGRAERFLLPGNIYNTLVLRKSRNKQDAGGSNNGECCTEDDSNDGGIEYVSWFRIVEH